MLSTTRNSAKRSRVDEVSPERSRRLVLALLPLLPLAIVASTALSLIALS